MTWRSWCSVIMMLAYIKTICVTKWMKPPECDGRISSDSWLADCHVNQTHHNACRCKTSSGHGRDMKVLQEPCWTLWAETNEDAVISSHRADRYPSAKYTQFIFFQRILIRIDFCPSRAVLVIIIYSSWFTSCSYVHNTAWERKSV